MVIHAMAARKPQRIPSAKERLLEIIKDKSLLLEGGPFRLASGAMSDYYLDMKPTTLDPEGSNLIADIILGILSGHDVNAIGGLELGSVPIISVVTARSWPERPMEGFVVRKEKKGHGTDKKIDGNFKEESKVILFDDVTTTGGSVMEAVKAVRGKGGKVNAVITVVDRLEGATQNLAKQGIELLPIFTAKELLGK
jgi:orotate phosphoribosyltransferase